MLPRGLLEPHESSQRPRRSSELVEETRLTAGPLAELGRIEASSSTGGEREVAWPPPERLAEGEDV